VLEYRIGGGSWVDASPLIESNPYTGTVFSGAGNPLSGRTAFVGSSHGYISTRLNLASLSGQTVTFRWRMGLDQGYSAWGWWVDNIKVYTCGAPNVSVLVGGSQRGNYYIPANGSNRVSYIGANSGTVKVLGTLPVIAAERVIYTVNGLPTSFSEMMALPNNQLNNTYWLPWYNNVDLDTQLRIGNVSGSSATVNVYIGNVLRTPAPIVLQPGQSTRVSFTGVNDGPVKIVSNVNVVAAERVIYSINSVPVSFSEMMGLPKNQLNTRYWLPWYNNADVDTQLRIGNVSSSTATVHIYIGGVEMADSPFTLASGASTRRSYPGINRGPVEIVSNVNVVAAERVIYTDNGIPTSFSEMMGLPNSQLDTTYWLPWYNNVDLDTQLRFGLP